MTLRLVLVAIFTLFAVSANADRPGLAEINELSADMASARASLAPTRQAPDAVTEDEVGDADSFGRNKTYLGLESTRSVLFQSDCSGIDPEGPVCIETNPAPASTSVDETDLGSIQLPGGATKSLMCFTVTQFSTWIWYNPTAAQATGDMSLYTTVQIENDALLGLSDPNGNPFNGKLFLQPNGIIVSTQQSSLAPGAFELQRERTTRSCTGGFVSARSLDALGLTKAQIKNFFATPMTVRFGTQGNVSLVDYAQFFAGIRLYGD